MCIWSFEVLSLPLQTMSSLMALCINFIVCLHFVKFTWDLLLPTHKSISLFSVSGDKFLLSINAKEAPFKRVEIYSTLQVKWQMSSYFFPSSLHSA